MTTENKNLLENQAIANSDGSSSKFLGLSMIFHLLVVLLVVYLNYPAIEKKFRPETYAVEISETVKEKTVQSVPTPLALQMKAPVEQNEVIQNAKVETSPVQIKNATASSTKTKSKSKLTKLKVSTFEDEKLTTTNLKLPSKKLSYEPLEEKQQVEEITETPIFETPIVENDESDEVIPAPEIFDVSKQARSDLKKSVVEERVSRQSTVEIPDASDVRQVAELRQRPGNLLPRYSDFERIRRHEGQVSYLAYLTDDGRLTNFILTDTTGHTNLDSKSLNAYKQWRFFPGQEGWVELSQVWVLTGEPEQIPSTLRR